MCEQDNINSTRSLQEEKAEDGKKTEILKPDLKAIKEEFTLIEQGLQFEFLLKERKEPMPYIPRTGKWWIGHWAVFWGVNVDTINRNNEKIKYVPMKFGNTKVVNAAQFWDCLEKSEVVLDG